jgi:hypothetical protein
MKKIFLLLAISIIGMNNAFAQKNKAQNVFEMNTTKAHWGTQTRSVTAEAPALYQSGNTIYIDSSVTLTNLQVTITDLSDNILINSYITIIGGVEYSYTLDSNIENGTYKIQLTYGTKYLYGYFNIE